jgi:hypothetical protein
MKAKDNLWMTKLWQFDTKEHGLKNRDQEFLWRGLSLQN